MKKFILIILLSLFWIINCNANSINKVTMDIYIDKYGTAHVDESWDVSVSSKEYTEIFKKYYNLGMSSFSNFKVWDDTKEYTYINEWDISVGFDDKAYKNGIYLEGEDTELCWGISKVGDNIYHMSYDINNFIYQTSDNYQVFYWLFINNGIEPNVGSYDITIRTDEYISDNLDVWGFGDYGEPAYVADGVIKFVGESVIEDDEYVAGLAKFEPNTFTTNNYLTKTFNDLLKEAQNGSFAYKEKTSKDTLWRVLYYIAIIGFFGFFEALNLKKHSAYNLDYGDVPKKVDTTNKYFRDVPCNKDIYAASYIIGAYKIAKSGNVFFGGLLLKWVKDKKIEVITDKKESKIVLKCDKLTEEYAPSLNERQMFDWLNEASTDNVVTSKAFEKYSKNNYSKMSTWDSSVLSAGKTACLNLNYLSINPDHKKGYKVNYSFYEEANKVAGLKNFLIDFSSMKSKEVIEVHLWEDYLIFAQLFGIADKVAKTLKKLYPELSKEISYDYNSYVFIHSFSRSSYQAVSAARQAASNYSAGGGGFSSHGGGSSAFGGGHSGGGFR